MGDGSAFFAFSIARQRNTLNRVINLLQGMDETLMAGLVPSSACWEELKRLPAPWGTLSYESLHELRSYGGSLLPTLKRIRNLAQDHLAAIAEARARSSQAMAQALASAALVPIFGTALYFLMPGIQEHSWTWILVCFCGLFFGVLAAIWMMHMTESARWGGLPSKQRSWILAAQCAGERFLALVRSGNPPDLAWAHGCSLLSELASDLAFEWKASIWGDAKKTPAEKILESSAAQPNRFTIPAIRILIDAGEGLRKSVQISLMEGRSCTERAETVLLVLRQEMKALVDRELTLLSTKALKPLFIFVAPTLFGLLAFGLWLGWTQIAGGAFG